ncbi:MAG: tetratricopeptide (TPR) repeat protein [Verrucomicrobiales bacterium]|jgi:tetratricopeptide (TPR) repeat protein
MGEPIVIFLSAVSDEFHKTDPLRPPDFQSYRDVLAAAFRRAGLRFQIIVQEELAQGTGDLLQTLDREIEQSRLVIHLVGKMAGSKPEAAPLRRLRERRSDFLAREPELRDALGDDLSGLSYTQWEIYLAYHHDAERFVFFADPKAPQSPEFRADPDQAASQDAHRARLKQTGEHRETFITQRDLALKCVTAAFRAGLHADAERSEPAAADLDAAREEPETLVSEIADHIKTPDPKAVPAPDPAGVDVYLNALSTVAEARNLDLTALLEILDDLETRQREETVAEPTPAGLYDLALTKLALADYPAAMDLARRSVELGNARIEDGTDSDDSLRDEALSGWQLLAEAAKASGDFSTAIQALESGGKTIDQADTPLLWADFHIPLARLCRDRGDYQRAESLIDDIVKIHEKELDENDLELAGSLLLWAGLLLKKRRDSGAFDVASRAERIFAAQSDPVLSNLANAWSYQGFALTNLGQFDVAEPLFRRALQIWEEELGSEHPVTLGGVNDLASLLEMNRAYEEAEPMHRRALEASERILGLEHPLTLFSLNNLANLLYSKGTIGEAEPMYRRALEARERILGSEHPDTLTNLMNLAVLLNSKGATDEAEPIFRRVLEASESLLGPEHPDTLTSLCHLAALLESKGAIGEAEPMYRSALEARERILGPEHPGTLASLCHLATLLYRKGAYEEAEPMFRRSLEASERALGLEHPDTLSSLNNLAQLLQSKGAYEEAEPMNRRAVEALARVLGPDHPNSKLCRENWEKLQAEMKERVAEGAPESNDGV